MSIENKKTSSGRQILIKIKRLIPTLNPKEKEIATYINNHPLKVTEMTITELSNETDVSQGSIVKFCKKIDLEGFKELKYHLMNAPLNYLGEKFKESDNPKQIFIKTFTNSIQAMKDCKDVINYNTIKKVAHLLIKAEKVQLYGLGGSGIVAEDILNKFMRIGLSAEAYTDNNLQLMSASLLDENCIAMGISHSGRTEAIVNSLELAQKAGATTIALTNYPNTPITEVADYSLFSVAEGNPITGENATARLVQLAIIDALYIYITLHKKDAMDNLTKTLKAVKDTRI